MVGQGLQRSNATWKIVSNDDPIFIPECRTFDPFSPAGCDNWATDGNTTLNFVKERNGFLKFLDDKKVDNVVFITTDVHFPANIVLNQDFNNDGHNLTIYELVSGPISAGNSAKQIPLIRPLMQNTSTTRPKYSTLDTTRFRKTQRTGRLTLSLKYAVRMA